jgi:lipopolysaccharide/colanic/teichoic acid biosynthesis glycosyltransferase
MEFTHMVQRTYAETVSEFRKRIKAADIAAIFTSLLLVLYLRGFTPEIFSVQGVSALVTLSLIPFFFVVFLSGNHSWESEAYLGQIKFYSIPVSAALRTLFSVSVFAYLIKEPISRITVISIMFACTLALLAIRIFFRKGKLTKNLSLTPVEFLVVASEAEFESLKESKSLPGHRNTTFINRPINVSAISIAWREICADLERGTFAGLIIGDSHFPNAAAIAQISSLQSKRHIDVFLHTSLTTLLPRMQTIESNDLIRVARPLLIGRYAVIKRTLDIILSLTALVVLMPLMLATALAVKLTSRGPVYYTDLRVGRNNENFRFPKFRSMHIDADKMRSQVLGAPDESMPKRYAEDNRITTFGKFIRRWSIDELPQLWCVFIGKMSIVGPRPILRDELINVHHLNESRFIAKPGLTGLWQVSGRKEVLWETRMKQDVLYIETWSFINDLLLILRTFGTIFSGKGAM